MTGPDLDRDLEAIGRRLSPRLGQAQDRVVGIATAPARRPRPPRAPSRLGGAMLTLAVTAAFGTLLAVGVATRPDAGSTPVSRGPSVAMATTTPGVPSTVLPSGGDATPPPASVAPVATAPAVIGAAPTRPGPAATAPPVPAGDTVLAAPAPTAQPAPPQPTTAATAAPAPTAAPSGTPAPAPTAPATASPTAPSRISASPTAPAHPRVVLTQKDSGRTITIHQGDTVEVDLAAPQDTSHWTVPSSTDETVVKPSSGSAGSDGSAKAVFVTTGSSGSANVQASRVPACATATPRCLPPQRIDFTVTIVVA